MDKLKINEPHRQRERKVPISYLYKTYCYTYFMNWNYAIYNGYLLIFYSRHTATYRLRSHEMKVCLDTFRKDDLTPINKFLADVDGLLTVHFWTDIPCTHLDEHAAEEVGDTNEWAE